MKFELLHPADQLVMILTRIYEYGMTTTSGGNLSIRDENGDIWITPSGIDKGNLTRADIMQVKPDGTIIGRHTPSVELPIHRNIYKLRPDLRAIVHAHPPILVAFSLVRQVPDTTLIPNANLVCGKVAMAKYDVPGSEQLGANIAEQFAAGYNTVLMENHGVVCGAPDLYRAFMAFETITFSAKIELDARKLGTPRKLSDAQIYIDSSKAHPPLDSFEAKLVTSEEKAGRRDLCTLIHRSYDQRLFTSTQGTFSMRLSDGSLLITPYMKDRKYLEPEDIVRVKNGMGELGKIPSRSVLLHQKIYETHPEINSVIIAHPPAIMAFAVTGAAFDSRLIPESYISLREVGRLPYAATTLDVDGAAAEFTPHRPVIIVDNQCVIVTGNSLLNAFDRLEVLEYSAAAIIAAQDLGEVVLLSDEEIQTVNEAFHLN